MVIWRDFQTRCQANGREIFLSAPLPHDSGDVLLEQILTMPRDGRRRLGYDAACDKFIAAYHDMLKRKDMTRELANAFWDDWVGWLSRLGYWIDLGPDDYRETITGGIQ